MAVKPCKCGEECTNGRFVFQSIIKLKYNDEHFRFRFM